MPDHTTYSVALIPVLSGATTIVWCSLLVLLNGCWLVGGCLRILWPVLVTCHFIEILTVRIVVLTVPMVLLGRSYSRFAAGEAVVDSRIAVEHRIDQDPPLLIDT